MLKLLPVSVSRFSHWAMEVRVTQLTPNFRMKSIILDGCLLQGGCSGLIRQQMQETQPSCRLHLSGIEQVLDAVIGSAILTRPMIYSQLLRKWREDFKQSSMMARQCISVGNLYPRKKRSELLQADHCNARSLNKYLN